MACSPKPGGERPPAADVLDLSLRSSSLLFVNGETTERTLAAGQRVAEALGERATAMARWDGVGVRLEGSAGPLYDFSAAAPTAIDMNKVLGGEKVVDAIAAGRLAPEAARAALAKIAASPPLSLGRFVLASAIGAAALAVIFGAREPAALPLVALSGGAGALVRRWLARASPGLIVQPFSAALLAGVIAALAHRLGLISALGPVALCPCLLLVPGPHLLNGLLDVARTRVALGCARIAFAGLLISAICTGVLLGLWLIGASLPISAPARSIPLALDLVAAGFAVSAYGSFYSLPWRYLPLPIGAGVVAHGIHWLVQGLGASGHAATFAACLFVGIAMTQLARRLRLPFAAMSFAAVVAMMPGAILIRMAAGMLQLAQLGEKAPTAVVSVIVTDATSALFVLLAMGFGLVFPKLWLWSASARRA